MNFEIAISKKFCYRIKTTQASLFLKVYAFLNSKTPFSKDFPEGLKVLTL